MTLRVSLFPPPPNERMEASRYGGFERGRRKEGGRKRRMKDKRRRRKEREHDSAAFSKRVPLPAYLLRLITVLTRGANYSLLFSTRKAPCLAPPPPQCSLHSRALNCYKLPHRFAKWFTASPRINCNKDFSLREWFTTSQHRFHRGLRSILLPLSLSLSLRRLNFPLENYYSIIIQFENRISIYLSRGVMISFSRLQKRARGRKLDPRFYSAWINDLSNYSYGIWMVLELFLINI